VRKREKLIVTIAVLVGKEDVQSLLEAGRRDERNA